MKTNEKREKMKAIRDEIVALTGSPLYEYRVENGYFPVIGEGSHDAKIMFVGEAPGRNEAETGRPFCGKAGQVLDELLSYISIPRGDVYITNILKDRPPENRDPLPEEIAVYSPFLDRQIDIIQPKIIAALGRYSMAYIMKKYGLEDVLEPISRIHGNVFEVNTLWGSIKIVPLYHPAVATYDASMIEALRQDFSALKSAL
ncbi:uracil-DNA glycosylase [Patescibacteria group bacterium]|nr:MAG: uracil-DNA glycosylase [Patescibacteria group bacterium]